VKTLRILHITAWYPHPKNEAEGSFIHSHVKALNNHCENIVLHVLFSAKKKQEFDLDYDGISLNRITINPQIDKWRLKEVLARRKIDQFLAQNFKKFDVINFCIAYPNAISIAYFKKKYSNLKFTITEHWSAYHKHFNLPENSSGRKRIEQIFHHNVPLFVVSNALGKDIQTFSKNKNLSYEVIPNSISPDFSFVKKALPNKFTFCSINHWSKMKNPIVLIDAFHLLNKKHVNTQLILGGEGELLIEMKRRVNILNLKSSVKFLGQLSRTEVKETLSSTHVYCQSSYYETFSVICVEALTTGTPVIATNKGGMTDYINDTNGFLVDKVNPESWYNTMEKLMLNYGNYSNERISTSIHEKYNERAVGKLFYDTFQQLLNTENDE